MKIYRQIDTLKYIDTSNFCTYINYRNTYNIDSVCVVVLQEENIRMDEGAKIEMEDGSAATARYRAEMIRLMLIFVVKRGIEAGRWGYYVKNAHDACDEYDFIMHEKVDKYTRSIHILFEDLSTKEDAAMNLQKDHGVEIMELWCIDRFIGLQIAKHTPFTTIQRQHPLKKRMISTQINIDRSTENKRIYSTIQVAHNPVEICRDRLNTMIKKKDELFRGTVIPSELARTLFRESNVSIKERAALLFSQPAPPRVRAPTLDASAHAPAKSEPPN